MSVWGGCSRSEGPATPITNQQLRCDVGDWLTEFQDRESSFYFLW